MFKKSRNLALILALVVGVSFDSCRKRKSQITVQVSVTDANSTKVWRRGDDGRLWVLLIRTGEGIGGQKDGSVADITDETLGKILGRLMVRNPRRWASDVEGATRFGEKVLAKLYELYGENRRKPPSSFPGAKRAMDSAIDEALKLLPDFTQRYLVTTVAATKLAWLLKEILLGAMRDPAGKLDPITEQQVKGLVERKGFSAKVGSGIAQIIAYKGPWGSAKSIDANLKSMIISDHLVSQQNDNPNDAKIDWVKITYVDKKGKRIEDNIGEQPMGAGLTREYTVPNIQSITVNAHASQTGETKALAEQIQRISDVGKFDHRTNFQQAKSEIKKLMDFRQDYLNNTLGRRTSNAKVRLKVQILKDGVVISSKEIEAEKQVEATSVGYAGQNG